MALYIHQPVVFANRIIELVCFDCFCTIAYSPDSRWLAVAKVAHEMCVHGAQGQNEQSFSDLNAA